MACKYRITLKWMRWVGHVACVGKSEMHAKSCIRCVKGGDHSGIDVRIILKWRNKIGWDNFDWIDFMGFCEHSIEPSDSLKGRTFLGLSNDYHTLRKASVMKFVIWLIIFWLWFLIWAEHISTPHFQNDTEKKYSVCTKLVEVVETINLTRFEKISDTTI